MKKLALLLVVLALFVAPAVAGKLTIVADPDAVLTGDPGQLKVQFWVEDFTPLVGGIEWIPMITDQDGTDWTSSFTVNPDPTNVNWLGYDVHHNDTLWAAMLPFVGLSVGFMGYADVPITSSTWMMTINYNYTQLPDGTYTLAFSPDAVGLVYGGGQVTGYEVVNGTFIVGIPEPCTMALLGCGLVGLLGYGRKRIRKH